MLCRQDGVSRLEELCIRILINCTRDAVHRGHYVVIEQRRQLLKLLVERQGPTRASAVRFLDHSRCRLPPCPTGIGSAQVIGLGQGAFGADSRSGLLADSRSGLLGACCVFVADFAGGKRCCCTCVVDFAGGKRCACTRPCARGLVLMVTGMLLPRPHTASLLAVQIRKNPGSRVCFLGEIN